MEKVSYLSHNPLEFTKELFLSYGIHPVIVHTVVLEQELSEKFENPTDFFVVTKHMLQFIHQT